MSASYNKSSSRAGIGDIQWHLLNDGAGKTGKASGMKIEYSMSDEIDFAQKLSTMMRKTLMRKLLEDENYMYEQELNRIGLMHSHDTFAEELRKCSREQQKKKKSYIINAQESNLFKLFKMYED